MRAPSTREEKKAPARPRLIKVRAAPTAVTIESIKNRYIRRLNNLHVGAQITITALQSQLDEITKADVADRAHHFRVPSSGGQPIARIKRDNRGMRELLQGLIENGEFAKSLLSAISITEDFVANLLRLTLRAFPDRLLRGRRNGEAASTVELKDILGRTTEQVLDGVIQQRLARLMLGSPRDYLRSAQEWFGIDPGDEIVSAFVEIKATRDVLVHANGVTDSKYVQKAGDRARVQAGETVPIDRAYFDAAIATMKALIARLSERLAEHHRADPRLLAALALAS